MNIKNNSEIRKVGFWVGRFQIPYFDDQYLKQFTDLLEVYSRIVIVLTIPPLECVTKKNPLSFNVRKKMIQHGLPKDIRDTTSIYYIKDHPSDEVWSQNLDNIIDKDINEDINKHGALQVKILGNASTVTSIYCGRFFTEEVNTTMFCNTSDVVKNIGVVSHTEAFRLGCIYALHTQFDNAVPVVDCIILDKKRKQVLLGQKPNRTKWQFIGGFADSSGNTYEADVFREVEEETKLSKSSFSGIQYIGSFSPNDFRYRFELTKIKSMVFVVYYEVGMPYPSDDIQYLQWCDLAALLDQERNSSFLYEGHKPIVDLLINSGVCSFYI